MRSLYIISLVLLLVAPLRASLSDQRRKRVRAVLSYQQKQERMLTDSLRRYFQEYTTPNFKPRRPADIDSLRLNAKTREIYVYPTEIFCGQTLQLEQIQQVARDLQLRLPLEYVDYSVRLFGKYHQPLEQLIPNYIRKHEVDSTRLWGTIKYEGQPWVKNESLPYVVNKGLSGRHVMVWPSHGRFYRNKRNQWEWQRPYLFCSAEDLLSQSIVVPYLYPMLENAGGIVISPRERDRQTACVVVDNDDEAQLGSYTEVQPNGLVWNTIACDSAFAMPHLPYKNGVNPFRLGTARAIQTTQSSREIAQAVWIPELPKTGEYAVYISYVSLPESVEDAHYVVMHEGGITRFTVNQKMGGNTWTYLGTFRFREGTDVNQGVMLTNESATLGVVTADAVRFGGGMGRTLRGGKTSGLPAYLEAARYYTQWAGLPTELYDTESGGNDYVDDLRCRSNYVNYLSGGSVYVPNQEGLNVPIDLCLAVHTDAGYNANGDIYGTLSISTNHMLNQLDTLASGVSRMSSHDFAHMLAQTLTADLSATLGVNWNRRETWNRNYSETRVPMMPSAIIELLSHQNFSDMRLAHDPYVKFLIARSLYKSILRFEAYQHGDGEVVVQPLPVHAFASDFVDNDGMLRLTWQPTPDAIEPTALPTGYVVYVKQGAKDFDAGRLVHTNEFRLRLKPGINYAFKVVAVNEGGCSFPSEVLVAYYSKQKNSPKVMIVNGFTRISGPAYKNQTDSIGFDCSMDLGIPYQFTSSYCGRQLDFQPEMGGKEGPGALGFSDESLIGVEIAGNTFDYTITHGLAMQHAKVSYASSSREAIEQGEVLLQPYAVVDLILGEQRDASHNIMPAKTFPPALQKRISTYLHDGGRIFVSGSHIGKDMQTADERYFLSETLKAYHAGTERVDSLGFIAGLSLQLPLYNAHSPYHYPVITPDVLRPSHPEAFTAFIYPSGVSAGIAYPGNDYKTLILGVPFECISDEAVRNSSMQAIIQFLLE